MYRPLTLDGKPYSPSIDDLPCLIHGADHSGASLFTVSYVADLYRQGAKLLFLSGYHMARDEFKSQVEEPESMILVEQPEHIHVALDKRVIFVPREKAELFIEAAGALPDMSERIILIKNIDLFDPPVYEAVKSSNLLVLSGDIDKCAYKDKILTSSLHGRIAFSTPRTDIGMAVPSLATYQGYLKTATGEGTVALAAS